jgi:hypothetical protein
MWGTKSRFVDVFISKIGWNPGNEFGKHCELPNWIGQMLATTIYWVWLLRARRIQTSMEKVKRTELVTEYSFPLANNTSKS